MRDADIEIAKARIAQYSANAVRAQEKGQHIAAGQWHELARIEHETLQRQIARDKQREESWGTHE